MGQGKSATKKGRVDFKGLKACTHFKPNEIYDFFVQFRSEFPDGAITKEQFTKLYQDMYPDQDISDFADIVFRTYDEDGNGVVNFREFVCALSVTSRGQPAEKLRWSFRMYDADNSGFISRGEATAAVRAILRIKGQDDPQTVETHMHHIFVTLDQNRDDQLSEEEFITYASNTDAIAELLKDEKDTDSDHDD